MSASTERLFQLVAIRTGRHAAFGNSSKIKGLFSKILRELDSKLEAKATIKIVDVLHR